MLYAHDRVFNIDVMSVRCAFAVRFCYVGDRFAARWFDVRCVYSMCVALRCFALPCVDLSCCAVL